MQIQINADKAIDGHEPLANHVDSVVKSALQRFSEHITRVEVHLNKLNDSKSTGHDYRCLMEARIQAHSPIAVSDHAENLHQAIQGAAEKLKRAIDSTLGRIHDSAKAGGMDTDATSEEDHEKQGE